MDSPIELLEQLLQFDKAYLEVAILKLLTEGKIDFTTISNQYVRFLELKERDNLHQLIEAETCVIQSFFNKKTTDQKLHKGNDYAHTQRCLYLLNQSKRFNMQRLNEKYTYCEEDGKKASWYEQFGKDLVYEREL